MVATPRKHVVDSSVGNALLVPASFTVVQFAVGTFNPNYITNPTAVTVKSFVKKVLLQIEFLQDVAAVSAVPDQIDWYVWFNIAGSQTRIDPKLVGTSPTANQVFHQDGCLLPLNSVASNTGINGRAKVWEISIDVPPSLQLFNQNDTLELVVSHTVNQTIYFKYRMIYKEIYP